MSDDEKPPDEPIAPAKTTSWPEDVLSRTAPPPAPTGTIVPSWTENFRLGEVIPLRGWNCRIVGSFMDDDGKTPLGFALIPESMTAAEMKRQKVIVRRRGMRVVPHKGARS